MVDPGLTRFLATTLLPMSALVLLGCREAGTPTAAEPESASAVAAPKALAFRAVVGNCGVTTDNRVYCWGSNESGALGIGTETGPEHCEFSDCSTRPVRIASERAFGAVANACAITKTNAAFCWGGNSQGVIGDGTENDSPVPVRVAGGLSFRQLSRGDLHTCGVTTDNAAYCWGHNQAGELGDGSTDASLRPVKVSRNLPFRQVTVGNQFTCGVTTANVAYCWGMNTYGQLGIGSDVGPQSCFTGDGFEPCSTRPARVVRQLAFRQVSAGDQHACGTTTENVAYCWGSNAEGQLGRGTSTGPALCFDVAPCATRPVPVLGGLAFTAVDAGPNYTCGVATGAAAYCWGLDGSGQLGIGGGRAPDTCAGRKCSTKPLAVLGGHAFRDVQASGVSTCGVTTGDVAFCWGPNGDGQVGDGTTQSRFRPQRVAGPM
jgi:alpha-tubulin suppressor-like RCC1 family protein